MSSITIVANGQDTSLTAASLLSDSSQWDQSERVYKDPEYFSHIRVESEKKKNNDGEIATSFSKIKKKYQSTDFNYNEEKINARSWWDRVQERVKQFFMELLPDYHFNIEKVFYRVLIVIGLLVLAYIIYRLFTKGQKLTYKEEKEQAHTAVKEIEKRLMDTNLDILLHEATDKKDFILAIRYLHLINLKKLSQKEFIQWDYKKTNKEFLQEIKETQLQEEFSNTIRIYEYSWYGHFSVSEENFKRYKQQFDTFRKNIEKKRTIVSASQNSIPE